MTEFKVGDKVRRKEAYWDSDYYTWIKIADKYKITKDSILRIYTITGDIISLSFKGVVMDIISWSPTAFADRFDLVSTELNNLGGNMTKKTVFNVLVVNKKTGKIDKDVTVVAEDERQAILKAYKIEVEKLAFTVTERTTFTEEKPQTVILAKESKSE